MIWTLECAVKLKELGITKISHLCDISKEELGKELKLSVAQVRFYLCIGYFSNFNVRQSWVVSRQDYLFNIALVVVVQLKMTRSYKYFNTNFKIPF